MTLSQQLYKSISEEQTVMSLLSNLDRSHTKCNVYSIDPE